MKLIKLTLARPYQQGKEGDHSRWGIHKNPKGRGKTWGFVRIWTHTSLSRVHSTMLSAEVKFSPYKREQSHFLTVKSQVSSAPQGEEWTRRTEGQSHKIEPIGAEESQVKEKVCSVSIFFVPNQSNRIWSKVLGYRWWNSTAYVLQVFPRTTYILALKYFTTEKMCW